IGNPDLKATTAYNFDLLGEHYLSGIGILSGGFFYKSLDNIIYTRFFEQAGGPYDGFEVEQRANGETAKLYGFEVNWQQQFTFLPGFWNGFGIYANYTFTESKADVSDREDISLPGQAGNVANFAISYEKYGFMGRIGLNYHGGYISEVGEDVGHDIFYDDHLQLDFSASMRIYRGLQVYIEAINLTNEPLRYYIGQKDRPIQREFYSWWTHAGIKYIF
ncbi:MAG: TonB-dependent receptor domain-containing protein, partial [bacterium]